MKAIIRDRYGPPEVLRVAEVVRPSLGNDEVLIRVRAAEATKSDCEMRGFKFSVNWFWLPLRVAVGVLKPRRHILGGYFAGEVEATGKHVTTLHKGDRVFGSAGLRMGAYGELVALPESFTICPMPDDMSFTEAAAVPLGGLNALHFMRLANIQAGERVLINGAGGSIGAHAVQIAAAMGAHVSGVDSAIKEQFVRRLGAHEFIDYREENFARLGRRWDVIFDMVPSSDYSAAIAVLEPNGRYLSGNPRLSVMLRSFFTTRLSDKTARFAFARETKDELMALKDLIEDGKIVSIVDRVYPMTQAAEAHRRVESEERIGALVIDMRK